MLELCLLGCGGMMPLPYRKLTSLMARYNGNSILIDCGEGTQVAIKEKGWSFKPIEVICFTHYHADHISGLPGLLLTLGNAQRTEPLLMVGPRGLERVVNSLRVIAPDLPFPIVFHELKEKEEVLDVCGCRITAFRVNHNITCYGYTIEIDRAGKFDVNKAKENNVEMQYWNRLQKGETIELPDRTLTSDLVLGPSRKGIKCTYTTDTRPTDSIVEHAKDADLFICEGMYGEPEKKAKAVEYKHMTFYEAAELALMDTDLKRTFATGIAGFSHVIDSLSAIKYAKVKVVRDESGLAKDFEIEGEFPKYGNDDDRADEIGVWLLKTFMDKLKKHHTYRDSEPTTSILTITSNVVYGKATGAMPDGRKAGEPLSPGANPSYGAEQNGLLASLNSLTKLPYEWALDGISNTQTINPGALGNNEGERIDNLVNVMDGYFDQGAHHLNVNVFGKEKLIDAMEHPEKEEYANFTIRVSGYAVKFIDLTREQQLDVISRTCHERM